MMHLDLPQAHGQQPLEGFLFEWEIYNNNEHFFAQLRDMNMSELCQKAGFKNEDIHPKSAGSFWMDDKTPYADDGFEFPITIGIK